MMPTLPSFNRSHWFVLCVLLIGIVARFLIALRGHNFDYESYALVARLMDEGANVYARTGRYNYGPIWFYVLHLFNQIAALVPAYQAVLFRGFIIALLTLADVGIFWFLRGRFGMKAAIVFFLNPITIIMTGYHNQFDNIALLLGMGAVNLLGDTWQQSWGRRQWWGIVVLSLSLITKHILFAFPFWLAVKQAGIWRKLTLLVVPTTLFFLSFVPYWADGQENIRAFVFLYRSQHQGFFFHQFVPLLIARFTSPLRIWLLLLVLFAFVSRGRKGLDSLLLYTAIMVAAAPATANQYLAIVIPFIAAYLNPFLVAYLVVGSWFFLVDNSELHIGPLQPIFGVNRDQYNQLLIILLVLGTVWMLWRPQLQTLWGRALYEIRTQFRQI